MLNEWGRGWREEPDFLFLLFLCNNKLGWGFLFLLFYSFICVVTLPIILPICKCSGLFKLEMQLIKGWLKK